MTTEYERDIAERESARYDCSTRYFEARQDIESFLTRKTFNDGFDRAWEYLKSLEDK